MHFKARKVARTTLGECNIIEKFFYGLKCPVVAAWQYDIDRPVNWSRFRTHILAGEQRYFNSTELTL